MKEDELKKLKEELKEETNPKQIDKIKYLIQRTVNMTLSHALKQNVKTHLFYRKIN